MKILIVLRNIGPYHKSRFESLVNSNTNVFVFETRPDSKEYLWEISKSCKYEVLKFPRSFDIEQDIPNKDIDNFYKKNIPLINPDVIISVGWADRSYQRLLLFSQKKKIPCIVVSDSVIRTEESKKRFFFKEFLKRIILRGYSSAFVAGIESKNYLIKLGFAKERIFQPWNVVDNSFYQSFKLKSKDSKERYFLCVSRFLERKNLFNLIKSFSEYQKNGGNWGLKIIGSGDQYAKLIEYSRLVPYRENFEIINWLQIDDLVVYYKKASAFILPSYFDNWGLVVNEAIASGIPCIVSKNCGCAVDLIKNNITGFVFDPNKSFELENYMEKVQNLTKDEYNNMIYRANQNLIDFNLKTFSRNLKRSINYALKNPRKSIFSALILKITSLK